MPRLWSETIAAHRREVRDAIFETTLALVAAHGLAAVTMSQVAEATGIGRATLYKYFPDVEAILVAWHECQVAAHLEALARVRDQAAGARARLAAVLTAYAQIVASRQRGHGPAVGALLPLLHRSAHLARAHHQLSTFVRDLLAAAAAGGEIRNDVPPDELARYCLRALEAASSLPAEAAIHRLVAVTLDGLRPPP